jgi:hemoglobin-like flavoprotein
MIAPPAVPAAPAVLTSKQVGLIQESFEQVLPIADTAAALFYDRLFTLDPSLRALFRGDMKAQGRALMGMIRVVVNGLTRLEAIVPAVETLGRRHAGYGVKDEHYATVGDALLWTLGQGLGDAFTPAVRDAWAQAYTILAATMQAAAATAALPAYAAPAASAGRVQHLMER